MGSLYVPTIVFEDNKSVFSPGEVVCVSAEYFFPKTVEVESIKAHFKGAAFTAWSKKKQTPFSKFQSGKVMEEDLGLVSTHQLPKLFRDPERQSETGSLHRTSSMILESIISIVSAEEKYFDEVISVLEDNESSFIELEGSQSFSIKYNLPEQLPSSFEGRFGYIRYSMTLILKILELKECRTKVVFTVITPLNLNDFPRASKDIRMNMMKRKGFWCWKSLPLLIYIHAPVTGYCPGDVINLNVEIDNRMDVDVSWLRAYFRKVVTYRGLDHRGESVMKRAAIVLRAVERGKTEAGDCIQATLSLALPPQIPPSNLLNCSIIDLDYDLLIEVKISGVSKSLTDGRYVLVGTVPLVLPEPAPRQEEIIDLEGNYE